MSRFQRLSSGAMLAVAAMAGLGLADPKADPLPVANIQLNNATVASTPSTPSTPVDFTAVALASDPAPGKTRSRQHLAENSPLFDAAVNTWFDALADLSRSPGDSSTVVNYVYELTDRKANKANTRQLRTAIAPLLPAPVRDAMLSHLDDIDGKKLKGEFRLTYSEKKADVSAASEFYSLVRQAIDTGRQEVTTQPA